jgi:MFS family permease
MGSRKWMAAAGYGLSAFAKPFFFLANTWGWIAGVRWVDRVGKGIRTAPRDALVAGSVTPATRGLAFGFHRAADTAGAVVGLLIAMGVIWLTQTNPVELTRASFQTIVLFSLIPAALAVLALILGAQEVTTKTGKGLPRIGLRGLGTPFLKLLLITSLFTLGNSSDAFLVLRAQDLGATTVGILGMLVVFNLVYSLVSTPAGSLSDRVGRRWIIVTGWLIYAAVYLGFAFAGAQWQIWGLYAVYGLYYGMAYGTANAMIADLVPDQRRGTAYGTYHAVVGLLAFPASFIAGLLWQGIGAWPGLGPSAPFLFGGVLALGSAFLMAFWMPKEKPAGA